MQGDGCKVSVVIKLFLMRYRVVCECMDVRCIALRVKEWELLFKE
jgi:hypothetical protein